MKKFGEKVEGYDVLVLNEREIRAAAGILFLATFISLMFIMFKENFLPIKYVITFFFLDFLIRVLNPKFSPTLVLARLIVRNQTPEYVGAAQKKFAWIIGLVLAAIMFFFFVIINAYSPITGLICLICLIFLFFESAFGICLGCLFYPVFFKEKALYCSGGICDVTNIHEIQKVSIFQLLVLFVILAFFLFIGFQLNDYFSIKPFDLFNSFN